MNGWEKRITCQMVTRDKIKNDNLYLILGSSGSLRSEKTRGVHETRTAWVVTNIVEENADRQRRRRAETQKNTKS